MTNFESSKIHNKATAPTADNAALLLLSPPLRATVKYRAIKKIQEPTTAERGRLEQGYLYERK
jgi:hypothetical protein